MYHYGLGVTENHAEAVKLYRLAAKQGDADAQSNLGIMHANGDGVPQSNVRAYIWWSVAAAQGQEDAKRNRGLVTERLTPDQLTQAQQIATRCIDSDYQDCE
jgi:TPR repeat protein